MRTGHILTLIGVALYLTGALGFPWQHFALADVTASSIEVSAFGLVAVVFAALIGAVATFGLVTGHRGLAGRVNLGLLFPVLIWLAYAKGNSAHGFTLMAFEEVTMESGFMLGVWGFVLIAAGALLVLTTLPAWDEGSSFLRVLVFHKNEVVGDRVVYEPGTLSTAEAFGGRIGEPAALMTMPHFRVTPEGDCAVGFNPASTGKPGKLTLTKGSKAISEIASRGRKRNGVAFESFSFGERGTIDLGSTQVLFHFIEPVPGHSASPLLERTEVGAFTMAMAVGMLSLALLPILGWNVEAKRVPMCGGENATKCAGVVAEAPKLEEEKIEVTEVKPLEEEVVEEEVSKKAGGEEGKFGDPNMDPRVESKIPLMDGKMVEKIDPRQVGINKLLTENLGQMDAVAEVLKGDMASMSSKLGVAMGGEGSEFVLGHGAGGMGFTGDGSGGGGDGAGRIMGMGDIDTGGGQGVKAGLGDKGKKRVGNVSLSGSTASGFCKKSNIESVVKRRASAIRACYEQRLQVKKDLQGKIAVRWQIDTEGKVGSASATSDTMGDGETTNCLLRTIRRMTFEKPEGGVCVVQWPFVFSPG